MFNTMETGHDGDGYQALEQGSGMAFAASGLRVRQFYDAEAVSNATFYHWQKKLGKAVVTSPVAGFIDAGQTQMCGATLTKYSPVNYYDF